MLVVNLFATALLALPASAAEETSKSCAGHICIHITQNDWKAEIYASNFENAPAGVRIRFDRLQNVMADRKLPLEAVIPPGKRVYVAKLVRQDANRGASFPFHWHASYGDPKAAHRDAYLYRMPFGGQEQRRLSQGVNGTFSHTGAHRYSFDFEMPVGTPILAARAGRVVHVADGYTEAGTSEEFLPAANAVSVLHDDGTFATYAHLDPGAGVREGMFVVTGEVLGFSGNTGFSSGPHLHFSVWKGSYEGQTTLPIQFRDPGGRAFLPAELSHYRPGCHDGGRRCDDQELPSESYPASISPAVQRSEDGTCTCRNGAVITTHLPCRAVCP